LVLAWLMVRDQLLPCMQAGVLLGSARDQPVNVDQLEFLGEGMPNLSYQRRGEFEYFPGTRPQFHKPFLRRSDEGTVPVQPDELSYEKWLITHSSVLAAA